jgi:hypothetical protein
MKNNYHEKIVEYLKKYPRQYIKIEDIGIALLAPRSKNITSFDRAYQDLVANGRITICGNSIRINQ